MQYQDILYEERDGVARITIDRPKVLTPFAADLRGADRGDQARRLGQGDRRDRARRAPATRRSAPAATSRRTSGRLRRPRHGRPAGRGAATLIRDVPKPVIARVQGYAIGGGNVLATLCDFTIASEQAMFGQVGPEGGLGRSGLRHGLPRPHRRREEGARDVVPVPPLHGAAGAMAMGLVNAVVPHDQLDAEVGRWCAEIIESPDRDRDRQALVQRRQREHPRHRQPGHPGARMYYASEESKEGVRAFNEKRKPQFRKYAGA